MLLNYELKVDTVTKKRTLKKVHLSDDPRKTLPINIYFYKVHTHKKELTSKIIRKFRITLI